ncbi:hypothetical protein TWF730_003977 [Orbilia blumenaviensis]|uniref:Uncharacterized protein n=1 Tax=Orbilia blumenaviensis TaxID=1796055 RepID=A0AAV9U3Y4_9PEZI
MVFKICRAVLGTAILSSMIQALDLPILSVRTNSVDNIIADLETLQGVMEAYADYIPSAEESYNYVQDVIGAAIGERTGIFGGASFPSDDLINAAQNIYNTLAALDGPPNMQEPLDPDNYLVNDPFLNVDLRNLMDYIKDWKPSDENPFPPPDPNLNTPEMLQLVADVRVREEAELARQQRLFYGGGDDDYNDADDSYINSNGVNPFDYPDFLAGLDTLDQDQGDGSNLNNGVSDGLSIFDRPLGPLDFEQQGAKSRSGPMVEEGFDTAASTGPSNTASTGPMDMAYTTPMDMGFNRPLNEGPTGPVDTTYSWLQNTPFTGPVGASLDWRPNNDFGVPLDIPYNQPVNTVYNQPFDKTYNQLAGMAYKKPVSTISKKPLQKASTGPVDTQYIDIGDIFSAGQPTVASTGQANTALQQSGIAGSIGSLDFDMPPPALKKATVRSPWASFDSDIDITLAPPPLQDTRPRSDTKYAIRRNRKGAMTDAAVPDSSKANGSMENRRIVRPITRTGTNVLPAQMPNQLGSNRNTNMNPTWDPNTNSNGKRSLKLNFKA